jgi:RNA polymerase sigma-70 factor (ECF subfamily)
LLEVLPNIRRFAASLAGNLADADDLLQSTVERLLQRGLPDDAAVLPWSLKVCRNLWIDEVRSRNVRRDAGREPAVQGEQVLDGEQQVLGEMTLEEVRRVLLSMSEDQRAVLELVAVEGHSYREAAAILELPIGTVMSRLARARKALVERSGLTAS